MRAVFCNTSPMQYLYQIGRLEFLPALFREVRVGGTVAAELAAGVRKGVALPNIGELSWVTVRHKADYGFPGLGKGEAETIALGLSEENALLVMDDADGRKAAKAAGLQVIGTLGVLLRAKDRGLINAVAPSMAQLEGAGLWVGAGVRDAVLTKAGERS